MGHMTRDKNRIQHWFSLSRTFPIFFLKARTCYQQLRVVFQKRKSYNSLIFTTKDVSLNLKPSLFAHMNWLDWLLAIGFTALFGFIANLYLPPYGWIPGVLAALALLYLAKRRRDQTYAAAETAKDQPPKEDK